MDDYAGEKFLDKLYSNLYNSDEVNHTKENTDKRHEAIRRYLERLERVHSKANTKTKKELLRSIYYDKYIIKKDILREKIKKINNFFTEETIQEEIDKIIDSQKKSLDKWFDYLTNATANYPLWAKYWAFQGMLKMGNYDEGIGGYQKRSKDTEGPFVDANPEILAKAIGTIEKQVNKEELNDEELEKIVNSVSFSKIYTLLEKRYKENIIEYSGNEGIWIKYNQGSKEDALKLCESLQNKNTHWCTAVDNMAIKQVCGPYAEASHGGDFYVYYTKDKEENYSLPRIAMRMNNHDRIGEIRGILEGQNLEDEMMPILEEKLKEMNFVKQYDINKAKEKINDLKELTIIYKKSTKKEQLTEEELKNLFVKEYGFGWTQDPRVEKILNKRNLKKDFENVKDYSLKSLLISALFSKNITDIEINDEEFVKYYLNNNLSFDISIINCFNPKYSKNYDEFASFVVKKQPYLIGSINEDYITDYTKLANIAFSASIQAIGFINPKKTSNYEELAEIAVTKEPVLISRIYPKISNYEKLAKIAVSKDGFTIKDIEPNNVKDYDKLAELAVTSAPRSIIFINPEDVSNYEKLAKIAVSKNGRVINYVHPKYIKNYYELAKIAVTNDSEAINMIAVDHLSKDEYNKLLLIVKENIEKEEENKSLGFIDIFSITTLVMTLGFVILTIIKLFNK